MPTDTDELFRDRTVRSWIAVQVMAVLAWLATIGVLKLNGFSPWVFVPVMVLVAFGVGTCSTQGGRGGAPGNGGDVRSGGPPPIPAHDDPVRGRWSRRAVRRRDPGRRHGDGRPHEHVAPVGIGITATEPSSAGTRSATACLASRSAMWSATPARASSSGLGPGAATGPRRRRCPTTRGRSRVSCSGLTDPSGWLVSRFIEHARPDASCAVVIGRRLCRCDGRADPQRHPEKTDGGMNGGIAPKRSPSGSAWRGCFVPGKLAPAEGFEPTTK